MKTDDVDFSYFNKRRACMLRDLGRAIIKSESVNRQKDYRSFLPNASTSAIIEQEFDVSISRIAELANTLDPPNKVSLITEFERIRYAIGHTPTKQDIEKHPILQLTQYEKEFKSWEHFLERLGYDPWYRSNHNQHATSILNSLQEEDTEQDDTVTLEEIREEITHCLKDEPDMLQLFAMVDQNISELSADEIKFLISSIGQD